ncbi:hypothetical protein UACE39S_05065 [Ureibacillus acetophenoni]
MPIAKTNYRIEEQLILNSPFPFMPIEPTKLSCHVESTMCKLFFDTNSMNIQITIK